MNENHHTKGAQVNEAEHDLLTDDEVADALRISTVTLRKFLKNPNSPIQAIARIKVGSSRKWNRDSLQEFIAGKSTTTEE